MVPLASPPAHQSWLSRREARRQSCCGPTYPKCLNPPATSHRQHAVHSVGACSSGYSGTLVHAAHAYAWCRLGAAVEGRTHRVPHAGRCHGKVPRAEGAAAPLPPSCVPRHVPRHLPRLAPVPTPPLPTPHPKQPHPGQPPPNSGAGGGGRARLFGGGWRRRGGGGGGGGGCGGVFFFLHNEVASISLTSPSGGDRQTQNLAQAHTAPQLKHTRTGGESRLALRTPPAPPPNGPHIHTAREDANQAAHEKMAGGASPPRPPVG